jgi:hypothetical protein
MIHAYVATTELEYVAKNLAGAKFNCRMFGRSMNCHTLLSFVAHIWRINLYCIINAINVAGHYAIILYVVYC